MEASTLGIYIHLPYCVHHCVYCDFNVAELKQKRQIARYLESLKREILFYAERFSKISKKIDTLYIGGGTPSLISEAQMADIISTIRRSFQCEASMEITSEANPSSAIRSTVEGFRRAGVNRLSLGIQSFHPHHLQTLQRIHSHQQAILAVEQAKAVGFDNVNLDLIFGIPHQTVEEFQQDVFQALALNPSHLSTYQLTVDRENPLFAGLPPDDVSADMYEWALRYLPQQGYRHYEVSAFAKPGTECRHNLKYWQLHDFLGLGAGATSRLTADETPWGLHLKNIDDISFYCRRVDETGQAVEEREIISQPQAQKDFLVTQLRLLKGICTEEFERRFQKSLIISYSKQINSLACEGLLDSESNMLKLTPKGLCYLNRVLVELM